MKKLGTEGRLASLCGGAGPLRIPAAGAPGPFRQKTHELATLIPDAEHTGLRALPQSPGGGRKCVYHLEQGPDRPFRRRGRSGRLWFDPRKKPASHSSHVKDYASGFHGVSKWSEILARPHLEVDIDEVRSP